MRSMQEKLTVFLVAMVTCSRSPSENGSVISNESGKPNSGKGSPQKVMAQQKMTKEEGRKRNGEKCFLMKNSTTWLSSLPWTYAIADDAVLQSTPLKCPVPCIYFSP